MKKIIPINDGETKSRKTLKAYENEVSDEIVTDNNGIDDQDPLRVANNVFMNDGTSIDKAGTSAIKPGVNEER